MKYEMEFENKTFMMKENGETEGTNEIGGR